MSSSADGFDAAIEQAARSVQDALQALPTGGSAPVIVIDGRSGSGKTTLAGRLRTMLGGDVNVVALDDLYPGWDGLASGAEAARLEIMEPVAAGRDARWHRWDWARDEPGEQMITPADGPLIVEGCGALTAASAAVAQIRVWLESPVSSRRERALARDGEAYRPHWERWAAQEVVHLADDDPIAHATIVVDVP